MIISSVGITVIAGRGPISVQWAATSSVARRLPCRRSRVLPGMAIAVDHFRLILLVN